MAPANRKDEKLLDKIEKALKRKTWTVQGLADHFGVSSRRVHRYLHELIERDVSVVRSVGRPSEYWVRKK